MSEERRRIEINWVQTSAGALAAVSSAVLLSTVGVAGTVIGAALGSLAATLGSAVYSHYLRVSRDRVAAVAAAKTWARKAQSESRAGDPDATAELPADGAGPDDDAAEQAAGVSWREAFTGLPWRHILWAASALFVAVMIAIVTFEMATGRAVSSYTGGSDRNGPRSSVPGLGGGGGGTTQEPSPTATATSTGPGGGATGTVSSAPTAGGTGPATSTPTSTATTGRSPSATPTTPSATPTPTPTPTPAATGSPTPAG